MQSILAEPRSAAMAPMLLSTIMVYGVLCLPLLWLIVVSLQRFITNIGLWLAARRTQGEETQNLAPGQAVVRGRVRLLQGKDCAVRVEISQRGEEHRGGKGGPSYTWTEYRRRAHAEAFDIELPTGALLRCEPTDDILLVDDLDQERRPQRDDRTLAAELTPDEEVWAVGQLVERLGRPEDVSADPYRSLPRVEYTLVAPPKERLLVASEPLGRRYGRRMGFHLRWLFFGLVALLGAQASFIGYHLRRAKGVVVMATVTGKRYVSGKNSKHWIYMRLPASRPAGVRERLAEDAAKSTFRRARKGQKVAVLVVPGWPSVRQLGNRVTANWVHLIGLTIGAFGLAIAFGIFRERSRDWWAREVLTHHGKGTLEMS